MANLKCYCNLCTDKPLVLLANELPCCLHPNVYTIFNLAVVTPLITWLLLSDGSTLTWIGLILLTIFRGFLDSADGSVARRCKKTSKLGAFLDVLGDTLLVLCASIAVVITWVKSGFGKRKWCMSSICISAAVPILVVLLIVNGFTIYDTIQTGIAKDEDKRCGGNLQIFTSVLADNATLGFLMLIVMVKLYILILRKK